jgi:hypothetical protein
MQPRHALHHEAPVIAEAVAALIEAVRNDEAGDNEEDFDAEPAVIARVLEGGTLPVGEVVPADGKGSQSAQSAEGGDFLIGTWGQDTILLLRFVPSVMAEQGLLPSGIGGLYDGSSLF